MTIFTDAMSPLEQMDQQLCRIPQLRLFPTLPLFCRSQLRYASLSDDFFRL